MCMCVGVGGFLGALVQHVLQYAFTLISHCCTMLGRVFSYSIDCGCYLLTWTATVTASFVHLFAVYFLFPVN